MQNFLIVGLGNPGTKYQKTRHNVGFRIIESCSQQLGQVENFSLHKKINGELATLKLKDKIHLLKPLSFMNLSGLPVLAAKQYFKINLDNLLIVHDDIDLPLGQIRLSKDSGSGGHNGVRSIIEYLRSKNFARLRVGIATKSSRSNIPTEKFVLSNFSTQEETELNQIITDSCQCVESFIEHGLEKTMNRFN